VNSKNIMISVSSVISFIKERLENDIKEAATREMINVERAEIEKICSIAKASIDASFFKSSDQIRKELE
jgi:cysteinyl-tRNA synthetase